MPTFQLRDRVIQSDDNSDFSARLAHFVMGDTLGLAEATAGSFQFETEGRPSLMRIRSGVPARTPQAFKIAQSTAVRAPPLAGWNQ
jgi:hypothetical protein